jgi:hypothetical protein
MSGLKPWLEPWIISILVIYGNMLNVQMFKGELFF